MRFETLKKARQLAAGMTMVLVMGLFAALIQSIEYIQPPNLQSNGDTTIPAHAEVVIKTQQAANNALSAGAIRGIDVSQYQGNINWTKVAQDNVKFAMIRASYGLKSDPYFYKNVQGANDAGIMVGAYHYAKYTDRASMIQEAKYFIAMLKDAKITYPVALDVEAHRGLSRNDVSDLAVEFMDMVKAQGYNVMLYTYSNFIRDSMNLSRIGNYDLWVANYLEQPNNVNHKMWQHTSYGSVNGISGRVDINIAYQNLAPKKAIQVDANVSASIKKTLNERYDAGLPLDKLDMNHMNRSVITGLQTELNHQFDAALAVTGECDQSTLEAVDSIDFVLGETGGNITYLLQVKLFYKGLYTNALSGQFDSETSKALEKYQQSLNLTVTGYPNYETLRSLLYA